MATVSGHLKDNQGNVVQGFASFKLVNFGSDVPRVSATNVIVPIDTTLNADATGFFTGTLQGNDTITPSTTYYQVTYKDSLGKPTLVASYTFTGAAVNLDTTVPLAAFSQFLGVSVPASNVLIGPASGPSATPTFRLLTAADLTAAPGVGITTGDPIYATDSSHVELRDDFTGSSIVSQRVGQLGWTLANPNSFGLLHDSYGDPPPGLGWFGWSSGVTANNAAVLMLMDNSTNNTGGLWPVLDYPGWKMVWTFKFQRSDVPTDAIAAFSATKMSFYCGLGQWFAGFGGSVPRPPCFVGLRYDTDTTAPAISDATFKFEAVFNTGTTQVRNNAQGQVVDTLVVPAEHLVYRLELLCTAAGVVKFTLSGGGSTFTSTLTISAPNLFPSPATGSISVGNGLTTFVQTISTTATTWFGVGSKPAYSQTGGTGVMLNNPVYKGNGSSLTAPQVVVIGTGTAGTATGVQMTGFPALIPVVVFGNDSQAAPVAKFFAVDFFAFVWSTSLATTPLTLDATRGRYLNIFGA